MYLSNLGNALKSRFEQTGQPADLDAAIDLYRQAVAATPTTTPNAPCIYPTSETR